MIEWKTLRARCLCSRSRGERSDPRDANDGPARKMLAANDNSRVLPPKNENVDSGWSILKSRHTVARASILEYLLPGYAAQ